MKFDDLIETIDMLDTETADEVIDWQMSESPAAKKEHSAGYTTGNFMPFDVAFNITSNPVGTVFDLIRHVVVSLCDLMFPGLSVEEIIDRVREAIGISPEDERNFRELMSNREEPSPPGDEL